MTLLKDIDGFGFRPDQHQIDLFRSTFPSGMKIDKKECEAAYEAGVELAWVVSYSPPAIGEQLLSVAARLRGDLILFTGSALLAPSLTAVDGNLWCLEGVSLTAPALAGIGGDLILFTGSALLAPSLTAVGGIIDERKASKLAAANISQAAARFREI